MSLITEHQTDDIEKLNIYNWKHYWVPIALSIILIFISFDNFFASHVLAEFFSVGIAIMMFVIVWHTYAFSKNKFLMFLGIGFLWVGILDIFHTMFFHGMTTAMDTGNTSTQFWIAARFFESLILLVSPFFIKRHFERSYYLILLGIIFIVIAGTILTGYFPDTFIDGEGLTTFKIISEFLIIAILLLAILNLRHHKHFIDKNIYQLVLISICFTVFAEFSFTLYGSMSDVYILTGHIFKILSFWLIYLSIIRTSLVEPVRTLSHNLMHIHALHEQAQKLAKLGHWSLNLASNDLYWSDEIYHIFAVDPKQYIPSYEGFINTVHPEDRESVSNAYKNATDTRKPYNINHRLLLKDGSIKYVNEQGTTIYDEESGKALYSNGTVQDITTQKLAELKIKKLARTDPLTHLPNRTFFHEQFKACIKNAKRNNTIIALVMLDLDGFKLVNDTFGHPIGDKTLKKVSKRLLSTFREVDTIARLGGDEFAIIIDAPKSMNSALLPLQKALQLLHQPILIKDNEITIGASAGVSFYPENSLDVEKLMQMADEALYKAKNAGKNNIQVYS